MIASLDLSVVLPFLTFLGSKHFMCLKVFAPRSKERFVMFTAPLFNEMEVEVPNVTLQEHLVEIHTHGRFSCPVQTVVDMQRE